MADILAETADWFRHRHDPKETTMTTPPRNVLADIAAHLGQLGSNPLIARLAAEGLGNLLLNRDADHITELVRSLEQPHRQAEVPPRPQQAETQ